MKAVGNIERITKTMQMIATARFQAMQKRAVAAQAYTRKIAEVVSELADSVGSDAEGVHPLLLQPEESTGKVAVLVLTSNRGLCGGYNANIIRKVNEFFREHDDAHLEVSGKKGHAYFKFIGRKVDVYHDEFDDSPSYEEIEAVANTYMKDFVAGKYDAVYVIYTAFISMARQEAKAVQLLPMQPPEADKDHGAKAETMYDFSPEPEVLLAELLPVTVKTRLYQCFNESLVSEQLARMIAMKSATDSAGKMKKSLGRQYNRARQTAITTELSEIIGGAAALDQ
ncbi:ATP synthase gamma chain [Poriferisphaera corsica]|uniref:ATP synthase gamma chain n=2 Tax=Poriferisphaera corsica TaxID=2528020 RepID=A0A517YRK7_9BACT|nr:ATP synthase gamma chain [Poriferisphaera corsica]